MSETQDENPNVTFGYDDESDPRTVDQRVSDAVSKSIVENDDDAMVEAAQCWSRSRVRETLARCREENIRSLDVIEARLLEKLASDVPDFGPLDEPEDHEPKTCPHCGGEL